MGSKNWAAIPFRHIDHVTGKVFAMVPTRAPLQATVREVAEEQYETTCWDHICVLESRGDRAAKDIFDDFCTRFGFMDPDGLAAALKEHKEAQAKSDN